MVMRILILLLLTVIIGCKKDTVIEPVRLNAPNPGLSNYTGDHVVKLPVNWINFISNTFWIDTSVVDSFNSIDFSEDKMWEYGLKFSNPNSDKITVSNYRVSHDTLFVKNLYYVISEKVILDSSYVCRYRISNDSLYINGKFRGVKYKD
jgi:hypothetical protein